MEVHLTALKQARVQIPLLPKPMAKFVNPRWVNLLGWQSGLASGDRRDTVGKLKIVWSFRCCSSFPISSADLVLVALNPLGPQIILYQI